jgi:RNA polymerase sigma-70 factor (ECF subfamily)
MSGGPDFNALYREHYSRVLGLCRRLLNSQSLAEDATQEAFMRAYNNFRRYDPRQPFWHWIATIANNYCIDLLRKRTREGNVFVKDLNEEGDLPDIEDSSTDTLSQMVSNEDSVLITQAIEELPEKYRVPLVMAYYNDASYDDIAESLGISVNHVGVLLLRAKKQLRTLVEQHTTRKESLS